MTMKYVLCLAVLAVSLRDVRARISKETQMALAESSLKPLEECVKDLNLDRNNLNSLNKSLDDLDDTAKCVFACVLRKSGLLNEEGKVDVDKSLEMVMGLTKNSDDYKTIETIGKSCASVNDEKVSDGAKGCERTGLLISCVAKHEEF